MMIPDETILLELSERMLESQVLVLSDDRVGPVSCPDLVRGLRELLVRRLG